MEYNEEVPETDFDIIQKAIDNDYFVYSRYGKCGNDWKNCKTDERWGFIKSEEQSDGRNLVKNWCRLKDIESLP